MRTRWAWWAGTLGAATLVGCVTRPAGESTSQPEPPHGTPQAEATTPQPGPLRVTLTLSDGSKVIGEPALTALPLQTDYSKMEIPLLRILSLKFPPAATNAVVTLANGNKLSAALGVTELRLATLFGKVTIPLQLVTSMTVSAGGTVTIPRDGLVLWFPFDGVHGQEVADASEHDHTGKLFYGARIVADEGRRRDVLELDRGAHIRVPGSLDFALTNLTFVVRLKPARGFETFRANQVFMSTVSLDSFDGWEFFISGPGEVAWHCRLPQDHKELIKGVKLGLEDEAAWHFLAFTFAYAEGCYTVATYCDGKLLHREKNAAEVMAYSGQAMHIGINYDSPTADQGRNFQREYQGRMDDLMLFSRALSEQEITALYNSQR